MPLHLEAIAGDAIHKELFTWTVMEGMDGCDSVYISKDRTFYHVQAPMKDQDTCEQIGRIVYTLRDDNEKKIREILDIDLVLDNPQYTTLHFDRMRDKSSDSNEYYDVVTSDKGQHLTIETVNRRTVEEEILDTDRQASISLFPFQLTVFRDLEELNRWAGYPHKIKVGDFQMDLGGLGEKFAMPGGLFAEEGEEEECYSVLVGTVTSMRDVCVRMGKHDVSFAIAWIECALGCVPAAMSREVFLLDELKPGCVICMNVDVKADLSTPDVFLRARG